MAVWGYVLAFLAGATTVVLVGVATVDAFLGNVAAAFNGLLSTLLP